MRLPASSESCLYCTVYLGHITLNSPRGHGGREAARCGLRARARRDANRAAGIHRHFSIHTLMLRLHRT